MQEVQAGAALNRRSCRERPVVRGLTPLDRPLPPSMELHLRLIAAHMAEVEAQFADVGRGLKTVIETAVAGEDREGRKATMKRAGCLVA